MENAEEFPLFRRFRVLKTSARFHRSFYMSGGTFMVGWDQEHLLQLYLPNYGDLLLKRISDLGRYVHTDDGHVGNFIHHELDGMVKDGFWEEIK